MNYKFILSLTVVVIIVAIIAVIGRRRLVESAQAGKSPSATSDRKEAASGEKSFALLVPDDKADANAKDALIAAGKAKLAPALSSGQWINSDAATLESLRGRVVLVDFWTFGCYNCRNTLPTLKRFDAAYRDKGLTIVGVHTPESDYEKKFDKIKDAVKTNGIKYPVVTDTDGDTWRAFDIEAWPTVVILDKQGEVYGEPINGLNPDGNLDDQLAKPLDALLKRNK